MNDIENQNTKDLVAFLEAQIQELKKENQDLLFQVADLTKRNLLLLHRERWDTP